MRYKYDALARRVERYLNSGKERTKYTLDGLDVLVDNDDGTLTKYLNGPGIDNKLRAQTGSTVSYFLADHLGSTNGLTDGSGSLTSSASYDSFGNKTGNLATGYQFTGREYDNFSGQYFYRARFYDANLGRFASEDPIGFLGGTNLYVYAANQPLNFRDPFGWFPSILDRFFGSAHQNITERALAGLATPSQIHSIARSNVQFDKQTQDSIYAPYHAMRRYGQTSVEDARAEANEFVRNKICIARTYASRGWNTDAMYELGKAIHTLQDAKSPAHAGFQQAWPDDFLSMVLNAPHYVSEAVFPGAENIAAAEEATRDAWRYFNGAPMPDDFFR